MGDSHDGRTCKRLMEVSDINPIDGTNRWIYTVRFIFVPIHHQTEFAESLGGSSWAAPLTMSGVDSHKIPEAVFKVGKIRDVPRRL